MFFVIGTKCVLCELGSEDRSKCGDLQTKPIHKSILHWTFWNPKTTPLVRLETSGTGRPVMRCSIQEATRLYTAAKA